MASSTTLKLSEQLKRRVARVAEEAGQSPHAFMVAAIEAQTGLAERRRKFIASALDAEREAVELGIVYDGDEVLSYLQSRLTSQRTRRPRPRKI
jgi:predicted transcriptional regulator